MDNQIIINKLKQICFKEEKLRAQEFQRKYSKIWSRRGITVFLERDENIIFNEIIKEIFSNTKIHHNFSWKDVEKAVQDIITRALKEPRKKREEKIRNEVDSFFQSFSRNINDWIFIIPIENLKLSIRQLKINEVIFYRFTRYRANKYMEMIRSNLDRNKYYSNKENIKRALINDIKKLFVVKLVNNTCVEIQVKGTLDRARQKALRKLDIVLSFLKLFVPVDNSSLKSYFGPYGDIVPSNIRSILGYKSDKTEFHPRTERTGYLFPHDLDKEKIKSMKELGLNIILGIERKDNKADLEKRLLNSILWYSKAFDIPVVREVKDATSRPGSSTQSEENEFFSLGDKFLKLIVALECLLIFGRENKRDNISKRSSYILTDSYDERVKKQRYFKKAYDIRSKIVHEGGYIVSQEETLKLMNYVQCIIIRFIRFKNRWKIKTNEDFYQWLEKNRLQDRLRKNA